jgi:superfamily II DNA/RNA helicase
VDYISKLNVESAFVFCNRKRDIDGYARSLERAGVSVGALHGDMSQIKRTETLGQFKDKTLSVLVCSDVAARGIDISNVSYVFNMDLPMNAEDYIHRIGRTGRAGKSGEAYSFACLPEDEKYLKAVEDLIGHQIERTNESKTKASKKQPNPPKRNKKTIEKEEDSLTPTGFGDDLPAFMAINR